MATPVELTSPPAAISVVMAVHNGERFLRESVDSVLGQTLRELELVVVDDGSTDTTSQILAERAATDARLIVHRQANAGLAAALNRGCGLASGRFIARLDADDVALPDRLQRQCAFLAAHPEVALVGGAVTFIDEAGRAFADDHYPVADADIREAFEHSTPLVHSAVALRKEVFTALGGYRELFRSALDIDLWLRISERHSVANLGEIVCRYRIHPEQDSFRRLELQTLEALAARAAWRARRAGRPDPVEGLDRIDRSTLVGVGVSDTEITDAIIENARWLARTMSRAGCWQEADELWTQALAHAGPGKLAGHVHRERAASYAARGQRLRSGLEMLRAGLAGRMAPIARLRPNRLRE